MSSRRRPSEAKVLFVRVVEASLLVAIFTGVRVVEIVFRNPFSFAQAIWDEVYRAGNVGLVILGIIFLYISNWDRAVVEWFDEFTSGRRRWT